MLNSESVEWLDKEEKEEKEEKSKDIIMNANFNRGPKVRFDSFLP